jgi:hypothetical protein
MGINFKQDNSVIAVINMLKKFLHIVMAILLFVFTLGINFSTHYCAGNMVKVSLSSEHQACCADGKINCCDIISERFELDKNNLPVRGNYQFEHISENSLSLIVNVPGIGLAHTLIYEYFSRINTPPDPAGMKTVLARLQSYLL